MNMIAFKIRKIEFENRIFVSFTIVLLVVACCYIFFGDSSPLIREIGIRVGLDINQSLTLGYYLVAFFVLLATQLRMWAGSILNSATVMSFKVQDSKLIKQGPYLLVRNRRSRSS